VRLTLWYVLTLGASQLALGIGLFVVISRRFDADLDASLADATAELVRAAHTREVEARATGPVVDAVEELHIPDRALYLVDAAGRTVSPRAAGSAADPWMTAAAARALRGGHADAQRALPHERMLRLHAERFTLRDGTRLVAVAVADQEELEDRYAALIAAFGGAAAAALVLLAAGAWVLVRQSTLPIERTFAYMRRFMADAAHELRTPMTVLRSRAEIALLHQRDADAYASALRAIDAESRRMSRIIDDLVTLARADAGERPIERRPLYLDDVVGDAVGAAQAVAARRGVTLEVAAFEEAAVDGDETLLRQLVMILLDNAIKFTRRGGQVRVAVRRAGDRCTLCVDDTGVGIASDQLPHVFERFYRGDPARTRDHEPDDAATSGAGLGLAIARWIADAHGASIRIRSTLGEGTSVCVDVPAGTTDRAAGRDDRLAPSAVSKLSGTAR